MTKPRLFRIGPGLCLAILASVAVWAVMPREPDRPKILPSQTDSLSAANSAPDPHWILQQANAVDMTAAQVSKLTGLVTRWDRDTESLRSSLQAEAAAFAHDMSDRSGQPVNVQQVKQASQPVTTLSRQLTDARAAWWAEARLVLTPEQRRNTETAWAARWRQR